LLSVAQQKYDQGFGSRLDVIKGQVEVARAKRLLLTAQKEAIARRSTLKLVLGLASADTLIVADILSIAFFPGSKTLDSLLLTARNNNPGLQLQRSLVRAAALNVQAARLASQPDFNLDFSGGVEDDESKIELELRLPLVLWDRKAGLKSEAKFIQESAENDSAVTWLEISRQVTRAYYDYLNAQQTMRLFSQSLLDEAKTGADIALQAFQTGSFRFLDLIDARRTYLETAQEFIEAQAELRLEEIAILRATGTPFPGEKR
jgi:cobalt-zinc-cadmium efflux system outer membrane protein